MKTVLLLGAGASVAEADSQGILKEEWPPVDKNLIDFLIAHDVGAVESLIGYVKKEFNQDLKSRQISAEHLLNMIYSLAIKKERNGTNYSPAEMRFKLVLWLFQSAIVKTTNSINKPLEGNYYKLLNFLSEKAGLDNCTMLTFNYDLLLEIALSELIDTDSNIPLFSLESYGIEYTLRSVNSQNSKVTLFPKNGNEGNPPVLKLHGSLNWYWPLKHGDEMFDLERTGIDPKSVIIYEQKKVYEHNELLKMLNLKNRTYIEIAPMIVPPLFNKPVFFPMVLDPLWIQAIERLRKAESLIIFGYSLPDADLNAQVMLARAIAKNRTLNSVNIIDINAAVCDRFADKLGIESFCYYRTVDEFISQNKN